MEGNLVNQGLRPQIHRNPRRRLHSSPQWCALFDSNEAMSCSERLSYVVQQKLGTFRVLDFCSFVIHRNAENHLIVYVKSKNRSGESSIQRFQINGEGATWKFQSSSNNVAETFCWFPIPIISSGRLARRVERQQH